MSSYLPVREYRLPILEVLNEEGGSTKLSILIEKVYNKIKHKLNYADVNRITSSEVAWRNRLRWQKSAMIKDGLLAANAPRSICTITKAGRQALFSNLTIK